MQVTEHYYQFTHESLCLAYQTVEEYQLSFSVRNIERLAAIRQNEPFCLVSKIVPLIFPGLYQLTDYQTVDETKVPTNG